MSDTEGPSRMVLATERLTFHELSMDDLPFVADMLGDHDVMRHWPRPYTFEEARAWIVRHRARYVKDGYGYWLLRLKDTGEPVGQAGLLHQEVEGEGLLGLGWIVHKPFWRLGYAFEAASRCIEHAFCTLGEDSVNALIRPENVPSMALAGKLGMTPQRVAEYYGFAHVVMSKSHRQTGI